MFSLIRDRGRQGGTPLPHREPLTVSLENRIHLGTVQDRLALWVIAHLLLGNGRTEDLLGQLLPSHPVRATNAHVVMEVNASVPPP